VNTRIGSTTDLGEERIMGDPKVTKAMGDSSGVNLNNVIEVVMGDLSEKDQRDLELELLCARWRRRWQNGKRRSSTTSRRPSTGLSRRATW
jgi:hypothetical protein